MATSAALPSHQRRLWAALAFLVLAGIAAAATPGEVRVGEKLREANLRGLSGPARKLSDYRGKPLVINVWASWCPPCRAEMGSLDRLAKRGGRQFNVIGISTDDYPDKAQQFLGVARTSFSHFIDHKLELENMLGANRLPLTLLVDADGTVLAKYYGGREWDSAESLRLIGNAFWIGL